MEGKEKIALVLWILISVFFCAESLRLGLGTLKAPGSGFLPFGASLLTLLLAIILFVAKEKKEPSVGPEPATGEKRRRNIIYILMSLFLYPVLLDKLGFFLCTLLFVAFGIRVIGRHKWSLIIGTSLGVAGFSYMLFVVWLGIMFPKGLWVGHLASVSGIGWR
jgi:putative tricarboxylic transport membrane protein